MKPERWQQLDTLFHSALELSQKERAEFLDEACAGNDLLRREVEALLAAHQSSESFIENPALELEAQALAGEQDTRAPDTVIGQTIGHYRVIELLGAGGKTTRQLTQTGLELVEPAGQRPEPTELLLRAGSGATGPAHRAVAVPRRGGRPRPRLPDRRRGGSDHDHTKTGDDRLA